MLCSSGSCVFFDVKYKIVCMFIVDIILDVNYLDCELFVFGFVVCLID